MTAADAPPEPNFDLFARYYDLEFGAFSDDVPLYRGFADLTGDPVLELGCGTGRLLVPLARAGVAMTGIDRSAAMLDLARVAVARGGVAARVTLLQDDLRSLAALGDQRFGLIFCAINSFLHLESLADQRAALRAARRQLRPGGRLILDLFPPHPLTLAEYDGRLTHAATFHDPATGERIDKFVSATLDPAVQRIETVFFYDRLSASGQVERTAAPFVLRYIGRFELELLLAEAGFGGLQFYGSYDLEPFTAASERLIVVAEQSP